MAMYSQHTTPNEPFPASTSPENTHGDAGQDSVCVIFD